MLEVARGHAPKLLRLVSGWSGTVIESWPWHDFQKPVLVLTVGSTRTRFQASNRGAKNLASRQPENRRQSRRERFRYAASPACPGLPFPSGRSAPRSAPYQRDQPDLEGRGHRWASNRPLVARWAANATDTFSFSVNFILAFKGLWLWPRTNRLDVVFLSAGMLLSLVASGDRKTA